MLRADWVLGSGEGHGQASQGERLSPSLPVAVLCTLSASFLRKVFCGHKHTLGHVICTDSPAITI